MTSFYRNTLYAITIAFLLVISTGCSSMLRTGIYMAHPAFENIEVSLFRQQNIELVKQGLPGTILLLEGILETSPNDLLLLTMAAKSYTGLGMIVEDENPALATALYQRGTECGIRALKQNRSFRYTLEEGKSVAEAAKTITSETYVPALTWTAASMGSNVLLNTGDPMIAVDLGNVSTMINQANNLDGEYFYGFAHMFLGIINSMLPEAFGGDKQKAKKEFATVVAMNDGKFLLSTYFYARFYIIDEAIQKKTLREIVDTPDGQMPEIALMNQIAKAKSRILLKEKGEKVK